MTPSVPSYPPPPYTHLPTPHEDKDTLVRCVQSDCGVHSIFFQNEEIFIQLDELGELDKIKKWMNRMQAQKTF